MLRPVRVLANSKDRMPMCTPNEQAKKRFTKKLMTKNPDCLPKIYLIPAPDMDERAIAMVEIPDFQIHRIHLPPLEAKTNLEEFMQALASQIDDVEPRLLGFCYGGVLANDLAKLLNPRWVVLVSSIQSTKQLTFSRIVFGKLFLKLPQFLVELFGKSLSFVVHQLFRLQIKVPRIWLKHAQNQRIVAHCLSCETWPGAKDRLVQIHGERDALIPARAIKNAWIVSDGGHYLLNHHRKEVLALISKAFRKENSF